MNDVNNKTAYLSVKGRIVASFSHHFVSFLFFVRQHFPFQFISCNHCSENFFLCVSDVLVYTPFVRYFVYIFFFFFVALNRFKNFHANLKVSSCTYTFVFFCLRMHNFFGYLWTSFENDT